MNQKKITDLILIFYEDGTHCYVDLKTAKQFEEIDEQIINFVEKIFITIALIPFYYFFFFFSIPKIYANDYPKNEILSPPSLPKLQDESYERGYKVYRWGEEYFFDRNGKLISYSSARARDAKNERLKREKEYYLQDLNLPVQPKLKEEKKKLLEFECTIKKRENELIKSKEKIKIIDANTKSNGNEENGNEETKSC